MRHHSPSNVPIAGIISFILLFMGCGNPLFKLQIVHQSDQVRVQQHDIPVLLGKNNEVLELSLNLSESKELKEIQVRVDGDEVLEGIQIYQVFNDGEEDQKVPLASMLGVGRVNNIRINKKLPAGLHRFMISILPKNDISLLEKFSVEIPHIVFGNQQFRPVTSQGSGLPLRIGRNLRHHGDDGAHSFRIPGLATTTKGTLLAVYDVRWESSTDLQGDIDVGLSRSTDGGNTWEPMRIIMDMKEWGYKPEDENGIGDPAILVDHENNNVWLIGLWAHGKPDQRIWNSSEAGIAPEQTGQIMLVKSEDDGKSWSEPINITSQIKNPKWNLLYNGPGKGISMRDGTLVFAGQYKDEEDIPHSTIIFSKDKGKTWNIGTGAKPHTTEAQVVELNDGRLMLNMRDNRGEYRSVAITSDMGKSWTEHPSSRSALVEPVCMASLITFPENRANEEASWLFFSNPATKDGRYNLTIKASSDQGISWPRKNHLLLDSERSWGYSCLTVIDDEHLGILYESSQANMTFQIIKINDILSGLGDFEE